MQESINSQSVLHTIKTSNENVPQEKYLVRIEGYWAILSGSKHPPIPFIKSNLISGFKVFDWETFCGTFCVLIYYFCLYTNMICLWVYNTSPCKHNTNNAGGHYEQGGKFEENGSYAGRGK